ncbi:hypothetical protein AB833_06330 [Chromatiales bacterium (ex Bugula neritina AB1)]|nr:hypothetical protein AB833_06330 [Chromatiales bacterium (ex Bugula neritina AB1)]
MQPFEGIRVLDFTHVLAGPFCTYQLAVLGAEVIKVESPHEPDMMRAESASEVLLRQQRGSQYLSQSANKASVAIDFRSPEGAKILRKLAGSCDVIVENFRSGVLARAGLDYDSLREANPTLIYCSMTGFGQTGPKAGHPAYDNVIQAFSGLMAATGDTQTAPVRVGPPVLDYGTGAQAAFAIASALFQRSRTSTGQYIDVAMLDAALMLMSSNVVDTQLKQSAPQPPGNSSLSNAGYACFEAKQGLIMIGAFTAKQLADLWMVLDQPELSGTALTLSRSQIEKRLTQDRQLLSTLLLAETAQEWENRLNDAGVPAARVRTLDETLAHPQVGSRAVLQEAPGLPVPHEQLKVPVAAFSYEYGGPEIQHHGVARGTHTREVLQQLGMDVTEIAALEKARVVASAEH